MKKRVIRLIFLFGFISQWVYGQCGPSDCPMTLPPIGTIESNLNLSNAVNPLLGINGQYLRAVSLYINHDAIDELDIVLIAPNGSSISLSTFQGIQIGQNITFDLCFFNCSEKPEPDPGYPAVFESDAGYEPNGFYNGSYYPAEGCLEDLTGNINGTWKLAITDNFIQDGGTLLGWTLEFADNSGLNCVASCLPEICRAPETEIGMGIHTHCSGDSLLNFNLAPSFINNPQNASDFSYAYILVDPSTGLIIDVMNEADLRTMSPGIYLIYGLAYHPSDWSQFPAPNGSYAFHDLIRDMNSGNLCIRPSNDHRRVEILARPEWADVDFPSTICAGDTIEYRIKNFDHSLSYHYHISGGQYSITQSSDSLLELVWFEMPDTFRIIIAGGCDTLFQNIPVPIIRMPEYIVSGTNVACSGDTTLYTFTELPDTSYRYWVTIVGGRIHSFSGDSLYVIWHKNKNNNQLCTQVIGSLCSSLPKCLPINVPDPQIELIHVQSDSLCPGNSTMIWADSTLSKEINWAINGAEIISQPGTDTILIRILKFADSASVCMKFKNDCGDTSFICRPIVVKKSPKMPGLHDISSCQAGVFIESRLEDADSAYWKQLQGPSDIFMPPASPDSTLFELGMSGNYQFAFYAYNEQCSASDTVTIRLHEPPMIDNILTECHLDSFSVSFEMNSGKLPFIIHGDTVNQRSFQSIKMASGSSYQFSVTDANQCSVELSGSKHCPCVSYAEHENVDSLSYCLKIGDTFDIPVTKDRVLDANDTLLYIIHKDPENVLGSKLLTSGDGRFTFTSSLEPEIYYYLSLIVASQTNGVVDFTDSCNYTSQARPLVFHMPAWVNATDTVEACMNSAIDIMIKSVAEFPLEVTLQSDQGRSKNLVLTTTKQWVAFDVEFAIENWWVQHVNSNCETIIKNGIQIIGLSTTPFQISREASICIKKNTADTFNLSKLFLRDTSQKGLWATNSPLNIQGDFLIIGNETDSGKYDIVFTPDPSSICPSSPQIVTLHIDFCDCIPLKLPQQLKLCNLKDKILLPDELDVHVGGGWSLNNFNLLENPPVIVGDYLHIDQSSPGDYELQFQPAAEHQYCTNVYRIHFTVEANLSAGKPSGIYSFCQEEGITIDLFDLLEGEDIGGQWAWQNQIVESSLQVDSFSNDIHTFTYLQPGTDVCPSSSSRINIELIKKPSFTVDYENPQCFGESSGRIELLSDDDLNVPHIYYLNGQTSFTGIFDHLDAGPYKIQLENSKGCISDKRSIELVQPEAFSIEIGNEIEALAGKPFQVKLNIEEAEETQSVQISWFENATELENKSAILNHTLFQDAYISAIVMNHNDCRATDSVFINVIRPETEISLPNVINPRSSNVVNRTFGLGKVQNVKWVESIQIFDRWGNQLFLQRDIEPGDPIGFWDGTLDGEYMQEGVYIYNIVYKTITSERKVLKGDVSILY